MIGGASAFNHLKVVGANSDALILLSQTGKSWCGGAIAPPALPDLAPLVFVGFS